MIEPVAWMYKDEENAMVAFRRDTLPFDAIPLYTHPAKTLTDEEIANTWDDVRKDATLKSSMKDIQDFARAILKKAQEK